MGTFHNYIDGAWVPSRSGRTFENRNPANRDDLLGLFQDSGREDVEAAVRAAERAYCSWRLVPAPKRAEMLFAVEHIGAAPGQRHMDEAFLVLRTGGTGEAGDRQRDVSL